jgi:hypothetical protein
LGEVIPKRERLSTDKVFLSTEKEPIVKGYFKKNSLMVVFSGGRKGVISP